MDKLQDVIAEMRDWANGEGCFNDDPDGEPLPCVYYSQQAFLKLCDRLEAAQALQAAPEGGELLKGKVTFARLGIVTMHVDQSYFGDHMVGDGDDVLIYNVTRAAASSPSAALQAGEV